MSGYDDDWLWLVSGYEYYIYDDDYLMMMLAKGYIPCCTS